MIVIYFRRRLLSLAIFVTITALFAQKTEDVLWFKGKMITKIPTSHKVVALTFDDGPDYRTTPKILRILEEKNVQATFFVIGENVERCPTLLAAELKDGDEIGNHTFSHESLPGLSETGIARELDKAEKVITTVAPRPTLFRPPRGAYNKKVLTIALAKGYTVVLWSVDTQDWRRPPVSDIVNTVLREVQPGSIILLHDGKYPSPTPEALPIIIDQLKKEGYRIVTVSELLRERNP